MLNVLLLEHDSTTRGTLKMVLVSRGHHIDVCTNESEVASQVRQTRAQIVIVGLDGPESDIMRLIEDIQNASGQNAPIIIGVVDEEHVTALSPAVMDRINQILVRPLDVEMLGLQFDTFEQQFATSERNRYTLSAPQVPREALFALVDRGMPIGLILDQQGRIQFANAGIEEITNHSVKSLHGRSILSLIHPGDRAVVSRMLVSGDDETEGRVRVLGDAGSSTQVDLLCLKLELSSASAAFALMGRRVNIPENANPIFDESSALIRYGSELVAVIDSSTLIRFRTPAFGELLDPAQSGDAVRFVDRLYEEDRSRFEHFVDELTTTPGGQRRAEFRMQTSDGNWRVLEIILTNSADMPGVQGIIVNAHDLTERRSLEQDLARRAFLDPLTNLPNRAYFLNRLERALKRASTDGSRIAVLFLDLDRFKLVNDSLGHEIGDQLLITVAQRLKEIVRPEDMVARFGGDEMIILLDFISDVDEATKVADRVISDISAPLHLARHEVSVSASVGIALNQLDSDDANNLIRNADIALYRAKESGAGRHVVFNEGMARRMIERLEMENDLRLAFERSEFVIEFLPELDLGDGQLSALEVLTRWNHPTGVRIDPHAFMSVAVETGMIVELGRWSFAEACFHARRWRLRHVAARELTIAFNLSAREFQQPDLVTFIASTLDRYEIPPQNVRVEIDESTMATGIDDTLEKVRALRDMGIQLAIDNFGSGFSSLSYLTQFTFDLLKVDRQFISGEGRTASNLSIVRAVTSLAHALGMRVSAEGIETRSHLARVRAAGCDFGQGFLFSKSLDAASIEAIFLSADGLNAA